MKGLIYKEWCLFFKSIDKKLIIIAVLAVLLLLFNAGEYGGLLATIMLAMTIGIQNVLSFSSDEKINWKKYQLIMPVKSSVVVGSKYISVILTIIPCIGLGLILFMLSASIYRSFDISTLVISMAASVIIPLVWTAVCLPLTYWVGYRSAQTMGLLVIIPVFYLIKYFEDGPGLSALPTSVSSYIIVGIFISVGMFIVSYFISIMGYACLK